MKTIKKVAEEMLNNFESRKRENGSEYYALKKNIEWQQNIIHKAHLDRMPDDDIYSRIYDFLCDFADADSDATEEDFREIIFNKEPDPYTSDLTAWLNNDVNNVYYLTEVLEEFEVKGGFEALSLAQQKYIQEIGNALLDAIIEHLEGC